MILYNKIAKIGDYIYINKKKEEGGEIDPSPSLPPSLIIPNKKLLFIYHSLRNRRYMYTFLPKLFFFEKLLPPNSKIGSTAHLK